MTRPIPQDPSPESTFSLLAEGYDFIGARSRRLQTDIFRTRILAREAICMTGEEAARVFYDNDLFVRHRAMPLRLQRTLAGKDGVQNLDGTLHRHRKRLFMSLMTNANIAALGRIATRHWGDALARWQALDGIVLLPEVERILCRAVCEWAAVPLPEEEVARRTADFAAMIDAPGAVGARYLRGRLARIRTERWIGSLVRQVRRREIALPEDSVLHLFAWHRDPDGWRLRTRIAAVEILNILRPTVAAARFIAFSALALHHHPDEARKLHEDFDEYSELFVQEVRRFYPFFPFVGARARRSFAWNGHEIPEGARVFLDIYGTDHDARIWGDPDSFRPERFRNWNGSAFSFIPQGGGDHWTGHRCPGEWITKELMKIALDFFIHAMRYEVPPQDLGVDLARVPAVPASRLLLRGIVAVARDAGRARAPRLDAVDGTGTSSRSADGNGSSRGDEAAVAVPSGVEA